MKIKPYILAIVLCCSTIVLIRCKREALPQKLEQTRKGRLSDAEVLQKAKEYYKERYGPVANGRSSSPQEVPDWESTDFFYKSYDASAAAATVDTLYEIYAAVTPKYINHSNGVIKYEIFLMDNYDNGIFQTLEAIPNLNYYLDYAFTTRYSNFSGAVKLLNQNGSLYKSVTLRNGYNYDSTTSVSRRSEMESFSRIIIEGMMLKTVYVYAPYIGQTPGMINLSYIPGVSVSYNSPANVSIGAFPVGWGSAGGGGSYSTSGLYSVTAIRKDSVKNPCIQEQLNNFLLADGKGAIQNTINRIFGAKGDIDIIYRDRPAVFFFPGELAHLNRQESHFGGTTDAITSGEAFIDFNVDALKGLPKELIATVVIHESMHAILAARGYLVKDHHDIIANIYRDQMSMALAELFPNMPLQDRTALAWEGLQETYSYIGSRLRDAYTSSTDPGFKAKIKIILDYQSGLKGTPSGCK